MLFTPNDFNSSSVVSISGICHSMPHVWHETVTPLKNGNGPVCSAGDGIAAPPTNNPQSTKAEGKSDRFMGAFRAVYP
jgi:hypothetical protein